MNQVLLIAVDERTPLGAPNGLGEILSLAPGRFAGAALPLDIDNPDLLAAAVRLSRDFRVAIVPMVSAESMASRSDHVLAMLSDLAESGALTADATYPPTVLFRPSRTTAVDRSWATSLRLALGSIGSARVGWLNRTSVPTATPTGFDYSVDWPLDSEASGDPSTPRQVDAQDLAIQAARHHENDGALAHSVLIGTGTATTHTSGQTTLTGLNSPVEQFWLDSALRFAGNRLGFGIPYVFARFIGSRRAPLPSWLPAYLGRDDRSSSLCPAPAEPITPPKTAGIQPRIAVVVHLYYPDLWPEFHAAIETLPEPADVYVSTPQAIAKTVRTRILRDQPDAVVFGTRNIGRDVMPFLHVLRSAGADRYKYLLKLHSKKSTHMDGGTQTQNLGSGESWRRKAVEELAGSRERAAALLERLDADQSIGMVAPAGQLLDQAKWLCGTSNIVAHLHQAIGIPTAASTFPAGTMFWARSAAIAPLVTATASVFDFEREAGQVDGTLHHAIERCLAHVAAAQGYRIIDTASALVSV